MKDDPYTELEKKCHKQWFYFRAAGEYLCLNQTCKSDVRFCMTVIDGIFVCLLTQELSKAPKRTFRSSMLVRFPVESQ